MLRCRAPSTPSVAAGPTRPQGHTVPWTMELGKALWVKSTLCPPAMPRPWQSGAERNRLVLSQHHSPGWRCSPSCLVGWGTPVWCFSLACKLLCPTGAGYPTAPRSFPQQQPGKRGSGSDGEQSCWCRIRPLSLPDLQFPSLVYRETTGSGELKERRETQHNQRPVGKKG